MYCDTNFLSHQPPQSRYKFCINCRSYHNTLTCIATHFSHLPLQPQSQYNLCIETHLSPSQSALPTCNTPWCIAIQFPNQPTSLLQYNFLPLHTYVTIQSSIAIHFPLANTALQNYHVTIQCLYCDTVPMFKWAVAYSVPAPYFFFFLIFQNTQINL